MEFTELATLQRDLAVMQEHHVQSLKFYHLKNYCGFRHKYETKQDADKDFSKASSATCVLSLTSTGRWTDKQPWYSQTTTLATEMLNINLWSSAGLPPKNPFTVAFILEAVTALCDVNEGTALQLQNPQSLEKIGEAEKILNETLLGNSPLAVKGAAHLEDYPPSAFLTQLVVRVLKRRKRLHPEAKLAVGIWAWQQIDHELALRFSGSKTFDAYSLAYSVILVVMCSAPSEATPEQNQILNRAIDVVFETQLPNGSWPLSRPLFHYPKVGNAYCFEYEMLTQLLQQKDLRERVLSHIENLALTIRYLKETSFRLGSDGLGWASGHHPQLPGPESWSTAAAYHFLHELDRTLAEAIRRETFSYVGAEYTPPHEFISPQGDFAPNFLDSEVKVGDSLYSLRDTLLEYFVRPIFDHRHEVTQGRDLPKTVPISAVFFGPPGTSKTQLAKIIGNYLGWPLLTIDPSHLVRKGLDQIQAETNALFSMLASLEQVVVLLDEFDEMVRERTARQSEALSRFLTTAMLPKLAQIHDRRRIVFIVATNHIDSFDFAIRRPGRFDMLIQVMPPKFEAKLKHWPEIMSDLTHSGIGDKDEVKKQLNELTYAEFEELSKRIKQTRNPDHASKIILESHQRSTLMQKVALEHGNQTWAELCKQQSEYNRIPNFRQ